MVTFEKMMRESSEVEKIRTMRCWVTSAKAAMQTSASGTKPGYMLYSALSYLERIPESQVHANMYKGLLYGDQSNALEVTAYINERISFCEQLIEERCNAIAG